jgi:hypothetical protein
MSVARFRLLLVVTTAVNLWWISLPDGWSRLPASTQEILRYSGRDALLPSEHWLSSWNYYLYYSLLLAAAIGLFLMRRWGRTLLLIHSAFATALALVTGIVVSPPIDVFVGSVAVILTGVVLGVAYFSPIAHQFVGHPMIPDDLRFVSLLETSDAQWFNTTTSWLDAAGIEYAVQGDPIRDGAVRIFVHEEDASAARSVVAEAASELNQPDNGTAVTPATP